MNRLPFILCLLLVTGPADAARTSVGIFSRWGAFVETDPKKCFAVVRPPAFSGPAQASPFVSVSFGGHGGERVYARLRAAPAQGSVVLLRIDKRSLPMRASGEGAYFEDPQLEAAAVRMMRTGEAMAVEIRSASGRYLRDSYPLRGAASAIDAAAIACARG